MELEIFNFRYTKFAPKRLIHSFPLRYISRTEFTNWFKWRVDDSYVVKKIPCKKFNTIYPLWREICSASVGGNNVCLRRIYLSNEGFINGLLFHIWYEDKYVEMNNVLAKILSAPEKFDFMHQYCPEDFGHYFLLMTNENLKILRNCWKKKSIVSNVLTEIVLSENFEVINKLVNFVGIKIEYIVDVFFDAGNNYDLYIGCVKFCIVGIRFRDYVEKNFGVKIDLNKYI